VRADEQLIALRTAVDSFVNDDPYTVLAEMDAEASGEFILRAHVLKEPCLLEWGLIAGDVVHNLRSALDYVVWDLSVYESGPVPEPIPDRSDWRRIEFPIFYDNSRYDGTPGGQGNVPRGSGPDKLWGVDKALHAEFRALQPFDTGQLPNTQPLWVLQELSNLDKHRAIPVVGLVVHTAFSAFPDLVGFPPLPPGFPPFEAEFFDLVGEGPFEHGANLGRMRLTGGLVIPIAAIPVQVDRSHAFDIAFDKGFPAYGGRVFDELKEMRRLVSAIIDRLATEFS
jgi:hypothetical protein